MSPCDVVESPSRQADRPWWRAACHWIVARPALLLLLFAIWLSLEYLMLGPYSYMRVHDTGDSIVTRYVQEGRSLLDHGVGYWSSYMACGVDRLSQGSVYLRPASLLFLLLPGWLAYQIVTLLVYFIAGYFTFRVCRDTLGLPAPEAILSGLLCSTFFGQSHGMLAGQLGIASFPMILFLLDRICSPDSKVGRPWVWLALLAILHGLSSSLACTLPFACVLVAAWFLIVRPKREIRFWLMLAAFYFVAFLCNLQLIWAMALNAGDSHRADWDYEFKWTLRAAERTLEYFWFLIALSVVGLAFARLRNRALNVVAAGFAFCLIGPLAINALKMLVAEYIGFLKGFQFDRFYSFAAFFGAVAGGLALRALPTMRTTKKGRRWRPNRAGMILIVLIVLAVSLSMKWADLRAWERGESYVASYGSRTIQGLAEKAAPGDPWRVATVGYGDGLHPAFMHAYGLETVDGYVNMYPERYQRFWSRVIEPVTRDNEYLDWYFNGWGNRVYLFVDEPGALVFGEHYRLELLSLANTKYIISTRRIEKDGLPLVPVDLGAAPLPATDRLPLSWRDNFRGRNSVYVYENQACFPRFFLVKGVRVFENAEGLFDALSRASAEELRDVVFLEKRCARAVEPGGLGFSHSVVRLGSYSPDLIELSVRTDGPAVLIASNTYSRFWKCRVNGRPVEILPAYGTFWGVRVDAGENAVTFRYAPPYAPFK